MQQIRLVVHQRDGCGGCAQRPTRVEAGPSRLLPVDRDNDRAEAREVLMSCISPALRQKRESSGWQWLWLDKRDHQLSNQGLPIHGYCYAM